MIKIPSDYLYTYIEHQVFILILALLKIENDPWVNHTKKI